MNQEEKDFVKKRIRITAGKLRSEGLTFETVTPELAKEKTKNCVSFHLLHQMIDNFYQEITETMKLITVKD